MEENLNETNYQKESILIGLGYMPYTLQCNNGFCRL